MQTKQSGFENFAGIDNWSYLKSSERARELCEVFTPISTVNEMLDLLKDVNYASKYLEPPRQ